jgi:fructokinase
VLGRPVRSANDADCFALSEAIDGAGAGAASVFGVIIGTGTGGGIVINGACCNGPNAIAGEWGHNPLPWPGADELPGPEPAIAAAAAASRPSAPAPASAPTSREPPVAERDAAAIAAAAEGRRRRGGSAAPHEHRLARALASVINLLDPEVIVLGGGLSNLAGSIATCRR